MKLTTTLCAIALLATQATAEGIKPEPKPPVVTHTSPSTDSGGADLLPILLGVILVGIIASRNQQPDLSTPRPLVRPDLCMDKRGVFVACGEEL